MKRILITGKGSYIGTSFIKHMEHYPEEYQVDELDVRGEAWKNFDFSKYDVVLHVAGIVHVKETKENRNLYFRINRDLAVAVADKAKSCGVGQFIFLSTMSVYATDIQHIDADTKPSPSNSYGKAKLEAEDMILSMLTESFSIAVIRPPMVYGAECKGNFRKLVKIAVLSPIFPDVKNYRSMIYIGNLCRMLAYIVNNKRAGIFFPQDMEYVCTTQMVKLIAEASGKRIHTTRIFNGLIRKLSKHVRIINKVFGTLIYGEDLSTAFADVEYISLNESIKEMYDSER